MKHTSSKRVAELQLQSRRFALAALGGTFDHLHQGHQQLLYAATENSCRLVIGVTTDEYVQAHKTHPQLVQPFTERVAAVQEFCKNNNCPCTIEPLSDSYGSAITNPAIAALFYTVDVQHNAHAIAAHRAASNLPELLLIVVPLLLNEADITIASTDIRSGEINRNGLVYHNMIQKDVLLNASQKKALAKPQGDLVVAEPPKRTIKIVVGDSTLEHFQHNHWPFDLAVIDGKKQREPYSPLAIDPSLIDLVVVNPASHITKMLCDGIALALKRKLDYVYVDGEEDLAAIVGVLLAPLDSAIYYGQPGQGIIEWMVTEATKEKAAAIIQNHHV